MQWYQSDGLWGMVPPRPRVLEKMGVPDNFSQFILWFNYLLSLLYALIVVDGVPDTGDHRMLVNGMLLQGTSTIFRAKQKPFDGAILTLYGGGTSGLSLYGYPRKGIGYGMDGTNIEFDAYVPGYNFDSVEVGGSEIVKKADGAVIYDNVYKLPPVMWVIETAKRIANMMGAVDVSIENLKTPVIIACNESEVNSIKAVLDGKRNNKYAILTAKGLSIDSIKVWNSEMSPEIPKTIWSQIQNEIANFCTIFGIPNNPHSDKRERMNVEETTANDALVELSLSRRLDYWNYQFDEFVNPLLGTSFHARLADGLEELNDMQITDIIGDYSDASDDGAGGGDANTGGDA